MMKLLEKLSSKMARTASSAVKEEVQGAALDILPTLIGIGGIIFGTMLYKSHSANLPSTPALPTCSTITITTNNYYFGDSFMNQNEEE